MAVYKATFCYPFLNTVDARVVSTNKFPTPSVNFKCKIDTSNQNVTGYSMKLLDENNNQIFPILELGKEIKKKISPVSELIQNLGNDINTGINGTYLSIGFFQNNLHRQYNSYNSIYYDVDYQAQYFLQKLPNRDDWSYASGSKRNILVLNEDSNWDGRVESGEQILPGDILLILDQNTNNVNEEKFGEYCGLWIAGQKNTLQRYQNIKNEIIDFDALTQLNKNNQYPKVVIKQGEHHDEVYQYNDSSTEFSIVDNDKLWTDVKGNIIPIYNNGTMYKWIITLYQGAGQDYYDEIYDITDVNYNNLDYSWYLNDLNEGRIAGSTYKRLQLASSNNDDAILPGEFNQSPLVLKKKYVQLYTDPSDDGTENIAVHDRFYVDNYTDSLGHAYLRGDNLSQDILDSNSKYCKFFKHSNMIGNLKEGEFVQCASITDINFDKGEMPTTMDGVPLHHGDLVLLKNQKNAAENGVYLVEDGVKVWRRSGSFDNWSSFLGSVIYVQKGVQNGNKNFQSLAHAGGKLYIYGDNSSGESPLLFVPEKPLILYDNLLKYNANFFYAYYPVECDLKIRILIEDDPNNIALFIMTTQVEIPKMSIKNGSVDFFSATMAGKKAIKDEDNESLYFTTITSELKPTSYGTTIKFSINVNYFSESIFDHTFELFESGEYNYDYANNACNTPNIEEYLKQTPIIDRDVVKSTDYILTNSPCPSLGLSNDISFKIIKVENMGSNLQISLKNEDAFKSGDYVYIAQGERYGQSVLKFDYDHSLFMCKKTQDLCKAVILQNTNTRTYISPYEGIKEGHLLSLKYNKKVKIKDSESNEYTFTNNIKILNVNKKFWYIEHDPLETPLKSTEDKKENTPFEYAIKSFFNDSDENPFNCYEEPYLRLESKDGSLGFMNLSYVPFNVIDFNDSSRYEDFQVIDPQADYQDFYVLGTQPYLTVYAGREVSFEGFYHQFQRASWESYRWILRDYQGNVLQDTGERYDKEMKVSFYGLTSEKKDHQNYYYAMLKVKDNLDYLLVLNIKIIVIVSSNPPSLGLSKFDATLDCDTHSVILNYKKDGHSIILPSKILSNGKEHQVFDPSDNSLIYENGSMQIKSEQDPLGILPDVSSIAGAKGVSYTHYFDQAHNVVNTKDDLLRIGDGVHDNNQMVLKTELQLNDNFCGQIIELKAQGNEVGQFITFKLNVPDNFLNINHRSIDNINPNRDKIEFVLSNNLSALSRQGFLKNADGSDYKWVNLAERGTPKFYLQKQEDPDYNTSEYLHFNEFESQGHPLSYISHTALGDKVINLATPLGNLCLRNKEAGGQPEGNLTYWIEDNQILGYSEQQQQNTFIEEKIQTWPIGETEESYEWIERSEPAQVPSYDIVQLDLSHCSLIDNEGHTHQFKVPIKGELELQVLPDKGYKLPEIENINENVNTMDVLSGDAPIVINNSLDLNMYPATWEKGVLENGEILDINGAIKAPFFEYAKICLRHPHSFSTKKYSLTMKLTDIALLSVISAYENLIVTQQDQGVGIILYGFDEETQGYKEVAQISLQEEEIQ